MFGAGVTSAEGLKARALAAREQFAASGTNISEWAREKGFSVSLVQSVLSGKRACRYGESHRIAVALGIKENVPPPGVDPADKGERPIGLRG
ncbi:DNA-binding protein [Sphingobium lactosutens]|uniref:DNA-binding protein n=1 Tax=Sphingobium lactosutens TaxID=522773 RepID=UPI0015B90087|nr:DNA-binding protein [Sphingobium lactosutens]NWK96536.1 DNA-binding protein [Sphingobium lactosutens]